MEATTVETKWIRCKGCGHKLFKLVQDEVPRLEIKCHSCKKVNLVNEEYKVSMETK